VLATGREVNEAKKETTSDYEITLEGEVKNMVEEKIRLCKQAGLKGQVSYRIQTEASRRNNQGFRRDECRFNSNGKQ
jgi:coproporphyrinogen III oxidase-like Fe-S oxidoreductase